MSREIYRARSKKVQKLGRDGLVERDRATGQEERVSQKAADISFGPERQETERTAPARQQQRRRQQGQYQREVRLAVTEVRTDSPFPAADGGVVPEGYAPERITADSDFPDVPVLDGYLSEGYAPEVPDVAPSMRGAVDVPMTAPPPVTENGPVLLRPRSRKAGKGHDQNTGKDTGSGNHQDGSFSRQEQQTSQRTESGKRLKFDGEKRISQKDSPVHSQGDAKSPSLRSAGDRPLADRSSHTDTPQPAKYRSDTGGRLRFDTDRKPEEKPDSRTVQKKQQIRQFVGETAVTEAGRLHFENAKPLSPTGNGTVTDGARPHFIPEPQPLPDVSDEDSEQQTETDAAEAALDVVLPAIATLRRPAKPKAGRNSRLKFDREAEQSKSGDEKRDSTGREKRRQNDYFSPDAMKTGDEERTSKERTSKDTTDTTPHSMKDITPESDIKSVPGENSGRLHFVREERTDRAASNKQEQRTNPTVRRGGVETVPQDSHSAKDGHIPAKRLEEKGRLRFDREQNPLPVSVAGHIRPPGKKQQAGLANPLTASDSAHLRMERTSPRAGEESVTADDSVWPDLMSGDPLPPAKETSVYAEVPETPRQEQISVHSRQHSQGHHIENAGRLHFEVEREPAKRESGTTDRKRAESSRLYFENKTTDSNRGVTDITGTVDLTTEDSSVWPLYEPKDEAVPSVPENAPKEPVADSTDSKVMETVRQERSPGHRENRPQKRRVDNSGCLHFEAKQEPTEKKSGKTDRNRTESSRLHFEDTPAESNRDVTHVTGTVDLTMEDSGVWPLYEPEDEVVPSVPAEDEAVPSVPENAPKEPVADSKVMETVRQERSPGHRENRPQKRRVDDNGRLHFEAKQEPTERKSGRTDKNRTESSRLHFEDTPAESNRDVTHVTGTVDLAMEDSGVWSLYGPEDDPSASIPEKQPKVSAADFKAAKTSRQEPSPTQRQSSEKRRRTDDERLRQPESQRKDSLIPALPEHRPAPENRQSPDAGKAEGSRLHFEEKPPKLTDDSQSRRKVPRLRFGIGRKAAPVKPKKSEQKSKQQSAPAATSGGKGNRFSGRKEKKQESRQADYDGRLRFEKQKEPALPAPDGPELTKEKSPITSATEDEHWTRRIPERGSTLEKTGLWTRTRRKQSASPADDVRNPDGSSPSDSTSETTDGQRKRQRLHFEPETQEPDSDPEEEGFTRNPPKRTEDDEAEETDTPPKKPRLRFEGQPAEEKDVPSAEQTDGNTTDATPSAPLTREDKQVAKAEKRVKKASRRLEKAQAKIPVRRRVKLEKQYDEASGKVKHRLQFEKEPIPEGVSALPLPLRGISGTVNSARMSLLLKGHQKIRETERQNVGVESAHRGELLVEQSAGRFLRWNRTRLRSKPYRAVRQAERALEREQVNLEWRRTLRDHPELRRKHALAKWVQKQKIRRKYAQAAREARQTEQHTQNILNAAGQIIRATAQYVAARKSVLAAMALLGFIVLLFSTGLTSCMAMLSGFQSSYISVSYMADEDDICEADLYYSEMETDLQIDIDQTESSHPGYDEYRYNVGEISHNPFELLSFLSTKYNAFRFRRIKSDIESLFWQQYTLTRTAIVETKYDSEGNPYDWHVLITTLSVRPLSGVIAGNLDAGEETNRYSLYMQTYGNRQAFDNPFDFAWLGRVSSLYGYRIHPITGAKNLHRGVDIAVPEGTAIKAVQDGRVVSAGVDGGYGLCVVIEDSKGYLSRYAHCSSLSVSAGQRVKRGDVIAAVGSTGQSTGPHLHLETMLDGEYLNPLFFVDTGDDGSGAVPGGSGGVVIPAYPGEAPTDETFARILEEAEKYLGYPYVWGGSSPETSFDCSGFVSWVINHSGWNVGRLGAQALYNMCTPVSRADARPGDLIFFTRTYSAPLPVTHVGIYVGNDQMIHCGDPIRYSSINTNYWIDHFYAFGRLP